MTVRSRERRGRLRLAVTLFLAFCFLVPAGRVIFRLHHDYRAVVSPASTPSEEGIPHDRARPADVERPSVPPSPPGVQPQSVLPPATVPAAAATVCQGYHVVKSGETLTSIAKAFGTTAQALRKTNRLDSERLTVGSRLRVPSLVGFNSASR